MQLDMSPSKNLRRYGQAQLVVQLFHGAIGFFFCIAAALLDYPVMSPVVYGDVITSIKAEWYSWPIFLTSMTGVLGILINGNWRFSPMLRLLSSVVQSVILWAFFVFAFSAESIDPFIVGVAVLGGFNIWFIALNVGDTVRAIRGRRVV